MTVQLRNNERRLHAFLLPHARICAAVDRCVCVEHEGRRFASSVTLPAGMQSPPLPDAVLHLPEVARLVKRGVLVVRRLPDPEAPGADAASASGATSSSSRKRTATERGRHRSDSAPS